MTRLRHLVAADVRHFRLLIAVWVGLVVASTWFEGWLPRLPLERPSGAYLVLSSNLISLGEVLTRIVLIVAVVQAHPLVGSNAFWMTRPISGGLLLATKLWLLGALVIGVPAASGMSVMAASGVSATVLAVATIESSPWAILWLTVIMAGAALTRSLAQFAVLAVAVFVAAGAGLGILLATALAAQDDGPWLSGAPQVDDPTPGLVFVVLAVCAGVGQLVVQYRTRSRGLALAAGIGGLALAFAIASIWPWSALAPRLTVPEWAVHPTSLRLTADPATVSMDASEGQPFAASEWRTFRARVRLSDVERGWSAHVGLRDASVALEGNGTLDSRIPAIQAVAPVGESEERPTRTVLRDLLGVSRLVDGGPPLAESAIVLFAREPALSRLGAGTGRYRGAFGVTLHQHHVEATLPLEVGAAHHTAELRFRLEAIERRAGSVAVVARYSGARPAFLRRPPATLSYYLRDRRTGVALSGTDRNLAATQALPLWPFGGEVYVSHGSLLHGGFNVGRVLIRFGPRQEDDVLPADFADLATTDLVIVRDTLHGSVERPLEIAGFPLLQAARSTTAAP